MARNGPLMHAIGGAGGGGGGSQHGAVAMLDFMGLYGGSGRTSRRATLVICDSRPSAW